MNNAKVQPTNHVLCCLCAHTKKTAPLADLILPHDDDLQVKEAPIEHALPAWPTAPQPPPTRAWGGLGIPSAVDIADAALTGTTLAADSGAPRQPARRDGGRSRWPPACAATSSRSGKWRTPPTNSLRTPTIGEHPQASRRRRQAAPIHGGEPPPGARSRGQTDKAARRAQEQQRAGGPNRVRRFR
jgi:hypothetical protein